MGAAVGPRKPNFREFGAIGGLDQNFAGREMPAERADTDAGATGDRPERHGPSSTAKAVAADDAVAVLRRAVELGVNHIDTTSFYAGGEVNRRIRQALAPYPDDLVIVSEVGPAHTTGGPIPLMAAQKAR
jgi:hypothetical protein